MMMMKSSISKSQNPKKPDEGRLIELAFKFSEELGLGTFDQCYIALEAAQGDEALALFFLK